MVIEIQKMDDGNHVRETENEADQVARNGKQNRSSEAGEVENCLCRVIKKTILTANMASYVEPNKKPVKKY